MYINVYILEGYFKRENSETINKTGSLLGPPQVQSGKWIERVFAR